MKGLGLVVIGVYYERHTKGNMYSVVKMKFFHVIEGTAYICHCTVKG